MSQLVMSASSLVSGAAGWLWLAVPGAACCAAADVGALLLRLLLGWKVRCRCKPVKWRSQVAASMGFLGCCRFQSLKNLRELVRCNLSKDVPRSRCHRAALQCRFAVYRLCKTRSASFFGGVCALTVWTRASKQACGAQSAYAIREIVHTGSETQGQLETSRVGGITRREGRATDRAATDLLITDATNTTTD
jgi:hypothetical protein